MKLIYGLLMFQADCFTPIVALFMVIYVETAEHFRRHFNKISFCAFRNNMKMRCV